MDAHVRFCGLAAKTGLVTFPKARGQEKDFPRRRDSGLSCRLAAHATATERTHNTVDPRPLTAKRSTEAFHFASNGHSEVFIMRAASSPPMREAELTFRPID
jgi:hypothetical protein